jgi:cbb3-type cytochrome oxidase maturation protein
MCPNCILNQAGLQSGVYISLGICLLFFVAAIAAMIWAFKNGQFEDIEGAKFDMLDDSEDSAVIADARVRVQQARAKQSAQLTEEKENSG